ncbi:YbdD/YjiX family protein [Micromonospora sp. WMMD1082]|uniref:YbdD/YjiX family protein n=1 Tax=Micromonospora sp. WMMD1082 TaxID=3016104 RepID=UPI002415B64C|nr:YbdD/YjiX family protein [Micromonospora sp. WMMD1082]MDG4797562.1 YbdD/YjiX family protein [Micromonospora sp. WMMD1082]
MSWPRARGRARSAWSALARTGRFALWYVREVVGENDYERYVSHLRRHHPQTRPVPRAVFERDKTQRLESRPNSRCC